MGFEEQVTADLTGVLLDLGEFSESIQYRETGPGGALSWRGITAGVRVLDPDEALGLGLSMLPGYEALEVTLVKDAVNGVLAVTARKDRLRRFVGTTKEREYEVSRMSVAQDLGGFTFYAIG